MTLHKFLQAVNQPTKAENIMLFVFLKDYKQQNIITGRGRIFLTGLRDVLLPRKQTDFCFKLYTQSTYARLGTESKQKKEWFVNKKMKKAVTD